MTTEPKETAPETEAAEDIKPKPTEMSNDKTPKPPSSWENTIPWILTASSLLALLIIGCFLIANINWFKDGVFENNAQNNLEFRVYAYQMHLAMIKRSVGLFSGFALMFIGTAVAFYTIRKQTDVDLKGAGFTAKLATSSPGIIAMLLGVWLILGTIQSKDDFPAFTNPAPDSELLKKLPNPPQRPQQAATPKAPLEEQPPTEAPKATEPSATNAPKLPPPPSKP